jgi:lipid II:glycine glycyltransferase (peptidoglycan interpeptide bridge formation enzyme)
VTFEVTANYDPQTWDGFVVSREAGHFMQSYAWGAFQREMGWEPRYCVLKEDSRILAAVLLLTRGLPGIGRVFYAPRGPAVDYSNASATHALLEHLAIYVKDQKGAFLRCDPYWTEAEVNANDTPPPHLTSVPRDWSPWNAPRFVLWLDTRGDEEAVFARLTSRCRNDVRRGYKNGVIFNLGTEAELEDFYRLMVATGHQKGIAFRELDYYRRLLSLASGAAKVQLFLGRFEGKVITAGVSVAYGKKAWLLYAASAPAFYKLRANRTQQWEMIKWAHALGCSRYDFRGTATNDPPSPDDPGYGVYEFKKSFGPEFVRLSTYFDLVQRPLRHRLFRLGEDYALPVAYRVRTWLQERPSRRVKEAADLGGGTEG